MMEVISNAVMVVILQFIGMSIVHLKCGLPCDSVVKNLPANARNMGSLPRLGRVPGEGHGNPLQYPTWEIPCRGA